MRHLSTISLFRLKIYRHSNWKLRPRLCDLAGRDQGVNKVPTELSDKPVADSAQAFTSVEQALATIEEQFRIVFAPESTAASLVHDDPTEPPS